MKKDVEMPEYSTPVVIPLSKMGRGLGQGAPCRDGSSATGICAFGFGAGASGCDAGTGGAQFPPTDS